MTRWKVSVPSSPAATRRRPIIVGYEAVPTMLARMLPTVRMEESEPERWCAACGADIKLEPVLAKLEPLYRTGKLSGECRECGIDLRELAKDLTEATRA